MNLKNAIFLAQSDTTAGFLSQSKEAILCAKGSAKNKAILQESCNLAHIRRICRIPQALNPRIRRAKKTTFIFPNNRAFRVVSDSAHNAFLSRFGVLFSSSANESGKDFDLDFAKNRANVVVRDNRGIFKAESSRIFRVQKNNLKKIR